VAARGLVVRGPHLSLRYPRAGDAAALYELGRDPAVTRFFAWGPYADLDQALEWVESTPAARRAGRRLELVVADRSDRAIGVTSLGELSRRDRRAVTGTWLGRPYWGSGANAESKALLLSLAFRRLGLERVTALVNPENARSFSALERLGFAREGVLRAWHRHPDGVWDCAVLRMLRAEFDASPLARVRAEVSGEPPRRWLVAEP
jgi:ribosomal-protein-alanine N-acetyltransferase